MIDHPKDHDPSVSAASASPAAQVEETYETEGPKCPYCGRQFTADDPVYFDEMRYTSETCDDCGGTFAVEVQTSTHWLCTATP